MASILLVFAVSLYVWWALPDSILDVIRKPRKYKCIFEKEIQVPKDLAPEKYRILLLFGATLKKRVILSFPPQQGMSVSESVELFPITKANEDRDDYLNFNSGKIENIQWDSSRNHFVCHVVPHRISTEDELGQILAYGINRGWKTSSETEEDIIKDFLIKWENKIPMEEKERGSYFKEDRNILDKMKRISKNSRFR